jgi:peptidoglycan/LPS O-acetylase OafA/YrhL
MSVLEKSSTRSRDNSNFKPQMRYVELDSLRGLAAVSVVVCHATNILPAVYDNPAEMWWLTQTPLGLVRAGHAAVIFFFVLSGFVLTLPFLKGPVPYPSFVARRICRIWIPYAAAMVIAVFCAMSFYPSPVTGLSHWANQPLTFPDAAMIADHLLLIGTFDNGRYNPVVWSLVYEMRISLIFPLLVLLLRLGPGWRVLGAAASLSILSLVIERLAAATTELSMTLHYAGLFVLGMVLARDMPKIQTYFARFSWRTKTLFWLVALVCYSHQGWIFPFAKLQQVPLYRDGLIAVAVTLVIIFALSPSRFSAWLQKRPFVFLGQVSYSIYLFHAVILLSLVHSLFGRVPLELIWIATGLLTIGVAALVYHAIEVPAIRMGRAFNFERRSPAIQPVTLPAREEQNSRAG